MHLPSHFARSSRQRNPPKPERSRSLGRARPRWPTCPDEPTRGHEHDRPDAAAVLAAGSEKAAAHRLGLSHSTVKHHLAKARSKVGPANTAQLVWILRERLPEPEARHRRTSNGLLGEGPWDYRDD